MTLDDILEEIKKAQTIAVMTHESPDGDAVSSSLSVMHAISQLNKEVDVVIPEYSRDFKFLPGSEKILEQGNHQELLKKKGHYYNLYNIQLDKDKYSK